MSTKIACDRCTTVIPQGKPVYSAGAHRQSLDGGALPGEWSPQFKDLCERCVKSMFEGVVQTTIVDGSLNG